MAEEDSRQERENSGECIVRLTGKPLANASGEFVVETSSLG